jgi:hypothetical protein
MSHVGVDMISIRSITRVGPNFNIYVEIKSRAISLLPLVEFSSVLQRKSSVQRGIWSVKGVVFLGTQARKADF